MFKKIFKWFLILSSVIGVLYTLYVLYRFYKNQELFQLYLGMGKIDRRQVTLAKVSDKKNKFLGSNHQSSFDAFDAYMEGHGWSFVSHFGRCTLFQCDGQEVLVRTTPFFNRYTLFEVLDSKYVQDFDENLLEVA